MDNTSTYQSERYTFYSSRELSKGTFDWFENLEDGSLTSTIYNYPKSAKGRRLVSQKTDSLILNYGNSSEDEVRKLGRFEKQILRENSQATISRFSKPEKQQRLHFKSYLGRNLQGERTGLISNANLSEDALRPIPKSKTVRKLSNALLGHKYQLNTAIEIKDKEILNQLEQIQGALAKNQIPQSTKNILIAKDSTDQIIKTLGALTSGSVNISSSFIDDQKLARAIVAAEAKGIEVKIASTNTDSTVDKISGGYKPGIKKFMNQVVRGGAEVYVPEADDPLMNHKKIVTISGKINDQVVNDFYDGSDNKTNAAYEQRSIDYMTYISGDANLVAAANRDFDYDVAAYMQKLKVSKINLDNLQVQEVAFGNISAPTQMSAEYFDHLALYNAARLNSDQSEFDYQDSEGIMSGIYRLRYQAHTGEALDELPEFIKQYDRELQTPGLGAKLNQYSQRHGLGKLYDDKVGALPSALGAIGKVLDNSFIYYSISNYSQDDYDKLLVPVDANAAFSGGGNQGFFESTLKFAGDFALVTGSGLLTYFTVGLPMGLVAGEIYKYSAQGLMDYAISQPTTAGQKLSSSVLTKVGQKLAVAASFGTEYLSGVGKGFNVNRQAILTQLGKLNADQQAQFFNQNLALGSINNIFYRKRGAIFYDNVVAPFILDVVNPYSQTVNNSTNPIYFNGLLKKVQGLSEAIGKNVGISMATGTPVITNVGFERARSIAKGIDELGQYLPLNPLKWGWGRAVMPNPQNFTAMSDVFSFNDLLDTFYQIYDSGFNGSVKSIVASSQVINNATATTRVASKAQSTIGFGIELGKTWASRIAKHIQTSPYNRLANPDAYKAIKRFKNISADLVAANNLYLQFDQNLHTAYRTVRAGDGVDEFLEAAISYHNIRAKANYLDDVQDVLTSQGNKLNLVNKIRGPGATRIVADKLITNRGIGATLFLTVMNAHLMLTDLMKSSPGVSMWTQFRANFFGDEYIPPVESMANRLLPTSGWGQTVGSIAFSSFAVGAGLTFGLLTQAKHVEKFSLESPVMDQLVKKLAPKYGAKAVDVAQEIAQTLSSKGIILPKGNLLRNASLATFAILGTKMAIGKGISMGINFVNDILGRGGLIPNSNTSIVASLLDLRTNTIARINAGEDVSTIQRLGAYKAGFYAENLRLFDEERMVGTRVIAQQAPIAFFQFFFAETIKGEIINDSGRKQRKGISSFTFGMQTAPILGGTFAFSLPIAYDRDEEKFLDRFKLHRDKYNINSFLSATGTLGGMLLLTEAGLDAYSAIRNIGAKDKKLYGNTYRNLINLGYSGLENIIKLPYAGFNVARASTITAPKAQVTTIFSLNNSASRKLTRATIWAAGAYVMTDIFYQNFLDKPLDGDYKNYLTGGAAVAAAATSYGLSIKQIDVLEFLKRSEDKALVKLTKKTVSSKLFTNTVGKHFVPAVIFTAAYYLMSDSKKGYSVGIDDNKISQALVVGALAASTTSVFVYSSEWGLDPVQTLAKYQQYQAKYGSNILDPLHRFKMRGLSKDIQAVSRTVNQYKAIFAGQKTSVLNSFLSQTNTSADAKAFKQAFATLESFDFNDMSKLVTPKGTLSKYGQALQTTIDNAEFARWYKYSGRGSGASRVFRGMVGVAAFTTLAKAIVVGGGTALGGSSNRDAVDNFYLQADQSVIGEAVADFFRLLTGTDSKEIKGFSITNYDSNVLEVLSGQTLYKSGTKLVRPNNLSSIKANRAFEQILKPMIIDPSNMFVGAPIGGFSFRSDKNGNIVANAYTQLQAAANDYSIATYQFALNTANSFQQYGKLGLIIRHQLHNIQKKTKPNSAAQEKQIARLIHSASASLDPLTDKNRRRYSATQDDLTITLLTSGELTRMVIQDRKRRTEEASYQPIPSLAARMTDVADPSQALPLGDVKGAANIYAALNKYLSKDDYTLLSGAKLENYLYHLSNPLGRTGGTAISIRYDRDLRGMVASETGAEVDEWIEESSLNALPKKDPFKLGKLVKSAVFNFVGFFHNLPIIGGSPLVTGAVSLAVFGTITAVTGGAIATSIMNLSEPLVFKTAEEVGRLFPNKKLFHVQAAGDLSRIKNNKYLFEITKGNRSFTIDIPITEGITAVAKRENLIAAQKSLQTGLDNLTKNVSALTAENTVNIFSGLNNSLTTEDLSLVNAAQLKQQLKNELRSILIQGDDSYLSRIFKEINTTQVNGNSLANLSGSFNLQYQAEILSSIDAAIESVIETEIVERLNPSNTSILKRFATEGLTEQSKFIGNSILNKILPDLRNLSTNLYILSPMDSLGLDSRNQNIINQVRETGSSVGIFKGVRTRVNSALPWVQNVGDVGSIPNSSNYNVTRGTFKKRHLLGTAVSGAWQTVGLVSGVAEGLDVYSGFADLAQLQGDEGYSYADRYLVESRLGSQVINSVGIGMGIGTAINLIQTKGLNFVSKAKGRGGKVGLGIAVLIGLSILGSKAYKNLNGRSVVEPIFQAIGDGYVYGSNLIGSGIGKLTGLAGEAGDEDATSFMGGFLTTVLIMATVAASRGKINATEAKAIAKVGLIAGGINTAVNFFKPVRDFNSRLIRNVVGAVEKNPAGLFFVTRLNEGIEGAFKTRMDPGANSPFFYGTFTEAVIQKDAADRAAADDHSGQTTASKLLYKNYAGEDSEIRSPFISGNINPANFVDPMIRQELNLRAAYYNQTIVGATIWQEKIKGASNYRELVKYTKSDPVDYVELVKQNEAQKLSNTVKQKTVGNSKEELVNLTAAIKKLFTRNAPQNHQEKFTAAVVVNQKDIKNTHLQQQQEHILAVHNVLGMVASKIKFKKSTEDNSQEIEAIKSVADNNDLYLAAFPDLLDKGVELLSPLTYT